EQGTCAYVPSNEEHCFINKGDVPLELICIVPLRGEA
ncbi:MAG: cupin domain-containing protein, partial [Peptococcaceae bacterium]|nr:cupin domain-containing protein [Peptococcaceae bacterium]